MYSTRLELHGTDSVGVQRSVISIVICWSSDKSSGVHRESSTDVINTFDQTHIFKEKKRVVSHQQPCHSSHQTSSTFQISIHATIEPIVRYTARPFHNSSFARRRARASKMRIQRPTDDQVLCCCICQTHSNTN